MHRKLGPGLLESAYEQCLAAECRERGVRARQQVACDLDYKGVRVDAGHRIDLLIEKALVVEVKAVERVLPVHQAQLLTSMKLMSVRVGLLLNFHVPALKDGVYRRVL